MTWEPVQFQQQTFDLSPPYDLGGLIPGGFLVKQVVINNYLPDGKVYITDGEVILSKRGWDKLVSTLQIRNECNVTVRRIVDDKLGDVLHWLREAGHDV